MSATEPTMASSVLPAKTSMTVKTTIAVVSVPIAIIAAVSIAIIAAMSIAIIAAVMMPADTIEQSSAKDRSCKGAAASMSVASRVRILSACYKRHR